MCILDCLLVSATIFYTNKAKIWMGVVTSLQPLTSRSKKTETSTPLLHSSQTTCPSTTQWSARSMYTSLELVAMWSDLWQFKTATTYPFNNHTVSKKTPPPNSSHRPAHAPPLWHTGFSNLYFTFTLRQKRTFFFGATGHDLNDGQQTWPTDLDRVHVNQTCTSKIV